MIWTFQAYAGLRFAEDHTLFARLIMKLTDLRNINEVHTQMLLRMKIDAIEPLLLEIFDLPVWGNKFSPWTKDTAYMSLQPWKQWTTSCDV